MSDFLRDMVMETTTSQGLGNLQLAGAVAGWNSFLSKYPAGHAGIPMGIRVKGGAWETGIYGYDESANVILRATGTFLASSTGSPVNWTDDEKIVYPCAAAELILLTLDNLAGLEDVAEARTNLGASATGNALFTSASAAAARTTLGLLSAALRDVGVAAANQVPDRAAADARYQAAGSYAPGADSGKKYVQFVTDGTVKILFYRASAPTYWTRDTSAALDDNYVRTVAAGSPGTTDTAGRQGAAFAETEGHALTQAQLALHTHPASALPYSFQLSRPGGGSLQYNLVSGTDGIASNPTTGEAGSGQVHAHGIRIRQTNCLLAGFTG